MHTYKTSNEEYSTNFKYFESSETKITTSKNWIHIHELPLNKGKGTAKCDATAHMFVFYIQRMVLLHGISKTVS
jgi:hypothetical protein